MTARWLGGSAVGLLTACASVTPLTNKIRVGEEPFVIAVGEGSDGQTDLYAAPAHGGNFVRLTFTRSEERLPELGPTGTSVAFFRRSTPGQGPWSLVVLDLLTNRESTTPIPQAGGDPVSLGWSRDGGALVMRGAGYLMSVAPPRPLWLRGVPLDSVPWADSTTSEFLGEPPAGRIAACPDGFCVVAGEHDTTRLEGVIGPIRWGGDSIGYFAGSAWEIRPLAGGRSRRPGWTEVPSHLREMTYWAGGASSPP
jgi:hypothetical protein